MNKQARIARSRTLARALDELDSTDPREIRRRALEAVHEAAEADWALFLSIATVDGRPRFNEVQELHYAESARACGGDPELDVQQLFRNASREACWTFDVGRPPDAVLEQFSSPRMALPSSGSYSETFTENSGAAFESTALYRDLWAPTRTVDIGSLLVFHGPSMICSIGPNWMRRKVFGPEDQELLAPLVRPVRTAVTAAHALSRQGLPQETAFLLVDPRGRIQHASDEGQLWLDRTDFVEAIRARVAELDRRREPSDSTALEAAEARVVRLHTKDGTRYLVCLRLVDNVRRKAASMLTPMQLKVATSAAAGATAEEIARDLGRSPETVREHLGVVYRKLRVSTRVELSKALAD